jgi:hypothetical protein
MVITEGILWVMMGFIPTLISMDVAWRLAKRQARKASIATAKSIRLLQPWVHSRHE